MTDERYEKDKNIMSEKLSGNKSKWENMAVTVTVYSTVHVLIIEYRGS